MAVTLFKFITIRDEFVAGFDSEEFAQLGGSLEALAKKLRTDGTMTVMQYVVRRAADGTLEQGPLHRAAIFAHDALRIEPYATPLPVAES